MKTSSPRSCTCPRCRGACKRKPGWFLPGEVEQVADFLGVSLSELFAARLAVDWWDADGELPQTFVLAPVIVGAPAGEEYAGAPLGRCIFFTADERCAIHAVKPYECATHWCGEDRSHALSRHKDVASAWVDHQDEIVELLDVRARKDPFA